MAKHRTAGYQTEPKEKISYGIFYLGQNIVWGFAGVIETFLTDIGIDAATAAAVLLLPKLWDAINDVLFGYIVDRFQFKNGQKYMPWVKIGTYAVGLSCIGMFAIPASLDKALKITLFVITYVLFDAAYTILDTPSFALATVMTDNIEERTGIIAFGKLWAMVGGVLSTLAIPILHSSLGWFYACLVSVIISIVMMIPMMYTVKERHTPKIEEKKADPTLKEMFVYLKSNKYLIVVLIAMFILGVSSIEQKMAIYMGRICLNSESAATYVAAGAAFAVIIVSVLIPRLSRKWDKFYVMIVLVAFSVVMDVVTYFAGYNSLLLSIILITLKCVGMGAWQVIIYMLIADTVEYGAYKSGTKAAGITFSLQCFIAKLKNAVIGSVLLASLAAVGFIEGENVIQPEGVADGVWKLFNLLPAVGFAIAIVLLLFLYKLRAKDVQTMADYNNGHITKEEAEAVLSSKYGSAG